jgi:hypothetical protein
MWAMFSFLAFSKTAHAVYYFLSDEQIKEAIEYGEKNKDIDYISFLSEWVNVSNDGYEWAALNTKFSILAYEAREAALASKKLSEDQIFQLISDVEDILSFRVVLYGNSSEFARDYHAVLLYKNKPIQPVNEQNDEHARPTNLGIRIPTTYRATCRYDFPNYYIEPDESVTLLILSPLSKERRFVFNLKEMR